MRSSAIFHMPTRARFAAGVSHLVPTIEPPAPGSVRNGNCYAASDMISSLRLILPRMAFLLVAAPLLVSSAACKSKDKPANTPPPAEEASASAGTDTATAPDTPPQTPPTRELASEEDRALVKGFVAEFTRVLESAKSDGWLELHSKAKQERLTEKDAIELSFGAWARGTVPVLAAVRSADFRLEKVANNRLLLTFEGVEVPNDPGAVFEFHVVVEDGALRFDEN